MKLKTFAEIVSGYAFRSAIKPHISGSYYVLQAKDIKRDEPIEDTTTLTKIENEFTNQAAILRLNDVVLVARGMKAGAFRATVFTATVSNVIASSSLNIIRITDKNVLPDYLALYLNSTGGQNQLSQIVTGTYIGNLSRNKLENLDIPLPPVEIQQKMVRLYQNGQEQKNIIARQSEIKQNIINEVFKLITTK